MYLYEDQWSKFMFLVLYVNDSLLASSDLGLVHETKQLLSNTLDIKDLREASFVLGIKIQCDIYHCVLGLSERRYVDRVLSRVDLDEKFYYSFLDRSQRKTNRKRKKFKKNGVATKVLMRKPWKPIKCVK